MVTKFYKTLFMHVQYIPMIGKLKVALLADRRGIINKSFQLAIWLF